MVYDRHVPRRSKVADLDILTLCNSILVGYIMSACSKSLKQSKAGCTTGNGFVPDGVRLAAN
jgi:uncharacterized protein (DUF2252 family)